MGGGRGRRNRRGRADPAGDLLSGLDADLELAERAARLAGRLLLERYHGPLVGVETKSSRTDPVSEADKAAEAAITELLAAERPDDGLVAEEGSARSASGGRRWVIDPLDGTTNYLYRFPAWCVSVALEDGGDGQVGVVHDPLRDETFRAARGAGCELNGSPVRVRDDGDLGTALVATGFGYDPHRRALQADTLRRLLPHIRDARRAGAAALDLAYVAAGRLDAFYERGLQRWDWAAGRVLVTEAGGVVRELPGEVHGVMAAGPSLAGPLAELLDSAPF